MPCQNLKIKGPSENANGKTEKNWSLRNLYPIFVRDLEETFARYFVDVLQKSS